MSGRTLRLVGGAYDGARLALPLGSKTSVTMPPPVAITGGGVPLATSAAPTYRLLTVTVAPGPAVELLHLETMTPAEALQRLVDNYPEAPNHGQ